MSPSRRPTGESWLAVVRPHIPATLIGGGEVTRLAALARHLPGECLAILEARLAPGAREVDLSIRLAEPGHVPELARAAERPALAACLARWAADRFDGLAPYAWLEFDLEREAREPFSPIPCVKLREGIEPEQLVDLLLPSLRGEPLTQPQRREVLRCCDAIPAGGRLLYAFSLHPRGSGAVRLELFGLGPPEIGRYLEQVAPETVRHVAPALALLAGAERLHLSIDVTESVSPRVGVEGSLPRLPRREPRWRALFDRLVAAGLCDPERRDAALAWPGYDTPGTAAGRWPGGTPGFCARALSHVKLVCRPDRAPEAKVYLLFTYLERRPAGRDAAALTAPDRAGDRA